jgi:hypothetical protein
VDAEPPADRGVTQGGGEEGLAHPDRDSDTLHQLRRLLPCEVRVTLPVHPLFGRLLAASGFKRWNGTIQLVVVLPDGTPGTIPADATDVLGGPAASEMTSVLSVEGARHLRKVLGGLLPDAPRSARRPKTRK